MFYSSTFIEEISFNEIKFAIRKNEGGKIEFD